MIERLIVVQVAPTTIERIWWIIFIKKRYSKMNNALSYLTKIFIAKMLKIFSLLLSILIITMRFIAATDSLHISVPYLEIYTNLMMLLLHIVKQIQEYGPNSHP